MGNLAITFGNAIVNSTPKVARRAKYLMQEATSSVASAEPTVTKAIRKSKYLQEPTETIMSASNNLVTQSKAANNILSKFNSYIGKDVDSIPITDCIELKELLTSTFRTGSLNTNALAMIKSELPFLSNNPAEYIKLLEQIEQRIQQYPIKFNYQSLTSLVKDANIVNTYNKLPNKDKTIVNLLGGLKELSPQEAKVLINQSGNRFSLANEEQIRLARMYEALHILQRKENLSTKEIEHIAYRLQSPKEIELLGLLAPKTKAYEEKLSKALLKVKRKQINNIEQTTKEEILAKAKPTTVSGHNVQMCNIDDLEKLSGFYHTPESYGDGMMGLPLKNDVYRRFANFKEVFSKPTNDMPVCFTYGTKDNPILWADNGFFVNVPKKSIHAGGTGDLGSGCSNLDSCIDSYIFGISSGRNNVGEYLQQGMSMPEILRKTTTHNEYLCSNGAIQAFYTNDLKTMDKAYLELAEKYNIPILNLNGKGQGLIRD